MFQSNTKKIFLLGIFIVLPVLLFSQQSEQVVGDKLNIGIKTVGGFSNGDYMPFWLMNNNHGIGSDKTNNQYIRMSILGGKNLFSDKFRISSGVDVITGNNLQSDIYIQQLYMDIDYKKARLSIGMKEQSSFFKNDFLSTGGMTMSGNARPVPRIEASFTDFISIPFTNNILHFKGGASFGYFADDKYKIKYAGDGSYTKYTLYHGKHAFIKFDNNRSWNIIIGFEAIAQFGGNTYENGELKYKNPRGIKDFARMFIHYSGGANSPVTDQDNKYGNVFGSYHLIFNYKQKNYSLKAYHEHIFEDRSGIELNNFPDGITGLEFNFMKKQPISSILLEFIHTKSQSGRQRTDPETGLISRFRGSDNYYNNGIYTSLSNYGYVMGNPLIISPIYNEGKDLRIHNNIVLAFHCGVAGYISDVLTYRLLLTSSHAYGTPYKETDNARKQFSSLVDLTYINPKLNGWAFSGAIAYDNAKKLIGNNWGIRFKISKIFNIK